MTASDAPTGPRAGFRLLVAGLALALLWYSVELVAAAESNPEYPRSELLERFVRFLPWQLVSFAVPAAVLAALVAARALSARLGGWLLLGAVTLGFVGGRVAEGALHTHALSGAALRVVGVTLAIAAVLAGLAACGRFLPARLTRTWLPAVAVGWTILWVLFLRRAGPALGLGELDVTDAAAYVRPGDLGLAVAAVCTWLALSALRRTELSACLVFAMLSVSAPARSEPTPPDVVVVLLDTFRADHLGAQGRADSPTPELDAFASEFFRFERAYSPSTRTSRAMPGIMTSLSVQVTGATLQSDAETLAEHLQRAGWSTRGISANPIVSRQFGYEQGFDTLTGLADAPDPLVLAQLKLASAALPGPAYRLGIADAELFYPRISRLTQRALHMYDTAARPAFLYLQTMDAHGPYLPPREFLPPGYEPDDFVSYYELLQLSERPELGTPEFQPKLRNLAQRYRGEVRYTDRELARFFRELKSRGRWDDTLVWILSDHGEAFGEHGFAGHGQPYVGVPVVQVPLWMKPPAASGLTPRAIQVPVSTFDLLPTTLALAGLAPPETAFGADLTSLLENEPRAARRAEERIVIAETNLRRSFLYTAIQGPWKLDAELKKGAIVGEPRLFDLGSDPGETADVAASHPRVVARLTEAIRERVRTEGTLAHGNAEGEIDSQTRARLRALGYVD